MTESDAKTTDKLARAEEFVRDELRLMGQDADAENPGLVRRVAQRIAERMP